ncbi:hypothetical protein EYZ11_010155 [Aspergillus tanneri]|uniref:NB-ARC domain-containing protein n=1 Tax=Aspergillus tanneri TaxID=1220188 RepID=A0A4V3UNA1_9EURO|nr:hypothetical protein EYZ11_010155 [Aspergillus tanneri]
MFTGRADVIQKISEVFLASDDFRKSFDGVFRIDASNRVTATKSLVEIAHIAGIEEDSKRVKTWLSNTNRRRLLIIDNADDPKSDVSEYFPAGDKICILLTTRNGAYATRAQNSWYFERMPLNEAVDFLLKAANDQHATQDQAKRLVETLGCHALAIDQAGAYMRNCRRSMSEYCDIYSHQQKNLLQYRSLQGQSSYKYSVYGTFNVSIQAIQNMSNRTSSDAVHILGVFGFLHHEGITEEIFEQAWKNRQKRVRLWKKTSNLFFMNSGPESAQCKLSRIQEAVKCLESFSLVKINNDLKESETRGCRMSMHPLVHSWARERCTEQLQKQYWEIASFTLAAAISWEYQSSDYSFRQSLAPHVDSCINLCKDQQLLSENPNPDLGEVAAAFVVVYWENGHAQKAIGLNEKAVKACQKYLGDKHPDTLLARAGLGHIYHELGRWVDAAEQFEMVLKERRRALGNKHPSTMKVIVNLANNYMRVGRRRECKKMDEEVKHARQNMLGPHDPDTLRATANLAVSYNNLRCPLEAARLLENATDAMQRTLGNKHPDTLKAMTNLAISNSGLGRAQNAVELLKTVLETRKDTLGSEHPDTARAAVNYISLRCPWKEVEQSEKALDTMQRRLGSKHSDTLKAMTNLAIGYSALGRIQDAVELLKIVLETREDTLGSEHPDTERALVNLKIVSRGEGSVQELIELLDERMFEPEDATQAGTGLNLADLILNWWTKTT